MGCDNNSNIWASDCNCNCASITLPVGTNGADGTNGQDGVAIVYNNLTAATYAGAYAETTIDTFTTTAAANRLDTNGDAYEIYVSVVFTGGNPAADYVYISLGSQVLRAYATKDGRGMTIRLRAQRIAENAADNCLVEAVADYTTGVLNMTTVESTGMSPKTITVNFSTNYSIIVGIKKDAPGSFQFKNFSVVKLNKV